MHTKLSYTEILQNSKLIQVDFFANRIEQQKFGINLAYEKGSSMDCFVY